MNLDTAKILAGSSAKLSGSTGISTMIMAYFQVNAAGIGALCTLITLIGYISFQWLAHTKTNQSIKNKEKIDDHGDRLESHIEETRDEFKKVGDGISSILNKLDSGK